MIDLLGLKESLSEEIESMKRDLASLSDRVPDVSDAGSVLEQQISLQNQLKYKRQRYQQIVNAIAKQVNGTYGICMDCGIDIPSARLEKIPDAPCCVDCQSIREYKRSAA